MKRLILRIASSFAALAMMFGLAACDAIPASGPVREGLESLDQAEPGVQFNPSRPVAGASREEIVRGFVRAASSSTGDYEVAREYLAPAYTSTWNPWRSVLVDDGTQVYREIDDRVSVLSLAVVASVDEVGTLAQAAPGGSTEVQFEFTQVNGEWRISSAPDGIILDKNTFTEVWAPKPLYFLSADERYVADVRWYLDQLTMSTQIVRGLLTGPSEQLAEALHTAFPAGTMLSSGTVPINAGVAVIDLSAELFDADDQSMSLLTRQLALSLQSVSGVTRFQLAVNGTVVGEEQVMTSDDASASPEAQFVSLAKGGEFGVATADGVRGIESMSSQIDALSPLAVSLSNDRKSAAVLNQNGVSLVQNNVVSPIVQGEKLLTPGIDPLGYVWTFDTTHPESVTVSRPAGGSSLLEMPQLGQGKLVAVRLSLGGNRLAILVEESEASVVLVAGVVRDETGAPVSLSDTVTTQLWTPGSPIDMDWLGDTRFAVLSGTDSQSPSGLVTLGGVGQFPSSAGAVAGGTTISGGGRSLMRVLDGQGRLFAPQGSGWQVQQSDVELLGKVG